MAWPCTSARVAVGVSGGVDSAVAALLLKNRGYDVQGVFIRSWDTRDETGQCVADSDCESARRVCNKIGISFTELNFVKEYWTDVFQYMLSEYEVGHTPVPDMLCNRHVKFGSLMQVCRDRLGCDYLATGHYARLKQHPSGGVSLLKGIDESKDQTFFLSQVHQKALQRTLFPLGGLKKAQVKLMAQEAGLHHVLSRKESMGICFIGKRDFKDFISQYVSDKAGSIIDIDTGSCVGTHSGLHKWTLGQRIVLSDSTAHSYYVASRCSTGNTLYVCSGVDHPALYSDSLCTAAPHWITPEPPDLTNKIRCQFRFQHRYPLIECEVGAVGEQDRGLQLQLDGALRVITQGQFAVLYDGEECLGSAPITAAGHTFYDLNTSDCRDALRWLRHNYLYTLSTADLAQSTSQYIKQLVKLRSQISKSGNEGGQQMIPSGRCYRKTQSMARDMLCWLTHGSALPVLRQRAQSNVKESTQQSKEMMQEANNR